MQRRVLSRSIVPFVLVLSGRPTFLRNFYGSGPHNGESTSPSNEHMASLLLAVKVHQNIKHFSYDTDKIISNNAEIFIFKKTVVLNTLVMMTMVSDVENGKN